MAAPENKKTAPAPAAETPAAPAPIVPAEMILSAAPAAPAARAATTMLYPEGTIVTVEPVYGEMVDLHTGKRFPKTEGGFGTRGPFTSWMNSQIEAGKMTVVKEQ